MAIMPTDEVRYVPGFLRLYAKGKLIYEMPYMGQPPPDSTADGAALHVQMDAQAAKMDAMTATLDNLASRLPKDGSTWLIGVPESAPAPAPTKPPARPPANRPVKPPA